MPHGVRAIATALVFAVACVALGGCDDTDPVVPVNVPQPASAAELVDALEVAYQARDLDRFAPLFHPEFVFTETTLTDTITTCRERWICLHRELFEPSSVPETLWLAALTIQVELQGEFVERPEYYASVANPLGLDPKRWLAVGAVSDVAILFETLGDTDYQVIQVADFVVVEDRTATAEANRFMFYRITSFDEIVTVAAGVEPKAWPAVLALYDTPCALCP